MHLQVGREPMQSPRDIWDHDPAVAERLGPRYVGTMASREYAQQVADLAEAYRLASFHAERFRVELHLALGIDPTPAPKVAAPEETVPRDRIGDASHRLDDIELIERATRAIAKGMGLT